MQFMIYWFSGPLFLFGFIAIVLILGAIDNEINYILDQKKYKENNEYIKRYPHLYQGKE